MSEEQSDKKLIAALEKLLDAQQKLLRDGERKFSTAMELLSDAVTNAQMRCLFYQDSMNMSYEDATEAFEAWQAEHGVEALLARCAESENEEDSDIEDATEKAWTADEIWKSLGE